MRIALLVALAYLVFVPFIINLVDARPRSDFYNGEPRYRAGLREFPTKGYHFRDKRYRYSRGELLPFFPSQVTCVFLITLAIRTGCKLEGTSRHLAALQKIRESKKASADLHPHLPRPVKLQEIRAGKAIS